MALLVRTTGPGAKPAVPTSAAVIERQALGEMSLDTFMASSASTLQDQGNLMALVEYLRRFDGEKPVLFVTEKGLLWPSDDNDRTLASVANDARASIHTLQAGGVLAAEATKELNATVQQARSLRSLRTIADLTGGLAAIGEKGQAALDWLDEMTRTGYVLGYQASNVAWAGGYRNIVVKVNRSDVTVLFRHGYVREPENGFPYTIQFPIVRGTQNIRFVVYDFGSDLVGRVDINVF